MAGQDTLWTANSAGRLTRWDLDSQDYTKIDFVPGTYVTAIDGSDTTVFAGTNDGSIWRFDPASNDRMAVRDPGSGWISALTVDASGSLWYADANHLDTASQATVLGNGLVKRSPDGTETWYRLDGGGLPLLDPLRNVTALATVADGQTLWVGTSCAGLLRYQVAEDTWRQYAMPPVVALQIGTGGTIWAASQAGFWRFTGDDWSAVALPDFAAGSEALSIAPAAETGAWLAGRDFLAYFDLAGGSTVYRTADNPLLDGRATRALAGRDGDLWLVGSHGRVHYDGRQWTVYGADARRTAHFTPVPAHQYIVPPVDFPSPHEDYAAWLATWPRPAADNGLGIHFLQSHQFDEIEAQRQVNRMQDLHLHWTVVTYQNHDQLLRIAPIFQAADITVVWRPFVRPYQPYDDWKADVDYLRARGMAPYMQLYNEPSLLQEWEGAGQVDQTLFLNNLALAAGEVYEAGGYVGLQFVDTDWLVAALRRLQSTTSAPVLSRTFFVPHLYGLNHPPEYGEDVNGVLGYRAFAAVFQQELGYVPPMIVGEGGWRPGEAQDDRFPPVSQELSRRYLLAVFDWFRTGTVSDGQPLPDYLFAFCPWLLADPSDPAAWFDGAAGNRLEIIQAVEAMPTFTRPSSGAASEGQ